MPATLRVRTQLGTWRVANVSPGDTIRDVRVRIESEHRVDLEGRPLTADPAGAEVLAEHASVASLGLQNGAMLYCMVNESKCGIHEASSSERRITKEGNIVAQEYTAVANRNGFRPGMMPLRNMKMQWTLNDFIALDSQFEYKITNKQVGKDNKAFCAGVSLEAHVMEGFHRYMLNFDYQCMRVGFLYGTFAEDRTVRVEAIYEPPQSSTDTSFELLEDPKMPHVEALAAMLGMRRVGWIFAHPTREKGFFFSGAEVIEAAEQQLLSAGKIEESPFVTIKCTVNADNVYETDAFQVSLLGMEMVAEGALLVAANPGVCAVNPTYTAIVEGRPASEVDTGMFLTYTAITKFDSPVYRAAFPPCNRASGQSGDDLRRAIEQVGKQGWSLLDVLSDFHLLLFLASTGALDMADDLPAICRSVVDRATPIGEGHSLLIRSLAGLDM